MQQSFCTILQKAQRLLGGRRDDAEWFKGALKAEGIKPCIPGRKSRIASIKYDRPRYERRSRIEIMIGGLKNWRPISTRCDRCQTAFASAVALAATVIFWP